MSFWHPAVVAYFVVLFIVYWFYKSAVMGIAALKSYITLNSHIKVDWLSIAKKQKYYDKLHHLVIIPEYNEPYHVIRKTIENLKDQDLPGVKITIVLATEAKDKNATALFNALKKEFSKHFSHIWMTKHFLKEGEVNGKSSNMAHAGKIAYEKLKKYGYDMDYCTVTSCDADSQLHPKYYSYLSYAFLTDTKKHFHFYQAGILFYSNIYKVPLPGRVMNSISSIVNLAMLSQKNRLINFSTYSLSLQSARDVGFWSPNVIPEDYHMFFKMYFEKGDDVKVIPLFLPTLSQAALSTSFWKTMKNQYEQQKRWAWGVSDVPIVLYRYILDLSIPFWNKTIRILHLIEAHIVWPTNWFILTLGAVIPVLLNKNFAKTALGHNLAQISSAIMTVCLIFLVLIIVLDIKSKPPRPKDFAKWKIPMLYMQWLTLPIVSFFLSALPGLDAHTRLMLGKKLEYKVTEKV
jgi:cellulose synthase/poly-beta-1,6-N-acetylglucosamine synthase-like glycosyltransferase